MAYKTSAVTRQPLTVDELLLLLSLSCKFLVSFEKRAWKSNYITFNEFVICCKTDLRVWVGNGDGSKCLWKWAGMDSNCIVMGWNVNEILSLYRSLVCLGACFRLRSAVLCTHLEHDTLIAGGFDGHTYLIDPRTSLVTSHHRYHHGSVLSIAVNNNSIVSVGEDSRLVVVDRRRYETNLVISVCSSQWFYFIFN